MEVVVLVVVVVVVVVVGLEHATLVLKGLSPKLPILGVVPPSTHAELGIPTSAETTLDTPAQLMYVHVSVGSPGSPLLLKSQITHEGAIVVVDVVEVVLVVVGLEHATSVLKGLSPKLPTLGFVPSNTQAEFPSCGAAETMLDTPAQLM